VIAFATASLACRSGSAVREYDGMILIVCGPHVEDVRPWCWAFAGYALAFTPALLLTAGRVRLDTFCQDNVVSDG